MSSICCHNCKHTFASELSAYRNSSYVTEGFFCTFNGNFIKDTSNIENKAQVCAMFERSGK